MWQLHPEVLAHELHHDCIAELQSLDEPQPGGLGISSHFIQPTSACSQPGTRWAQLVYIVGCDPVTSTLRVPLSSPLSHSTAFSGKLIWKALGPEFFT